MKEKNHYSDRVKLLIVLSYLKVATFL